MSSGVLGKTVSVALALAASFTAYALARTLAFDLALRMLLGGTVRAVEAGLVAGLLLEILALARSGRRRTSPLAALRWLFVVLVLFWLSFLAWIQPFERLWFEMSLALVLGAWAGLVAFEGWIEWLPARARRAAAVSLFSLCAAAVLLELALRAIAAVHPSPLFVRASDPGRQGVAQIGQVRLPPGAMRFGFPCNSGGHYDDEFYRKVPPARLVVSIGDSFGQGIVPHPFHFTTVCERALACPVDSMGIAGVGPPEYLFMLVDEALPLDPDVVVVDVFVGNDLHFAYPNPGSWRERARTWLLRENVLLWVVPDRLMRIAREKRRRQAEGGEVARIQGLDAPVNAGGTLEERFPWCFDPGLETPTFSEQAFLEIETGRADEISNVTPEFLAPFHDKMIEIRRAAGSIPLVVMLIPDEFQVEDAVWSTLFAVRPGTSLERDRAQRILDPWFEQNGIPCLDLLPILRAVPPLPDGRRHLYHLRDTHFNARGNRVAGEALAAFLRKFLKMS